MIRSIDLCVVFYLQTCYSDKRNRFAIVLDSPYRSAINKAVLKMQESGELGDLKKKWWKQMRDESSCDTVC